MTDPSPDMWTDTISACEELRAVLRRRGITLPELSIDVPGLIAGLPLIRFGSADADTARRLTAALNQQQS